MVIYLLLTEISGKLNVGIYSIIFHTWSIWDKYVQMFVNVWH